MGYLITAWVHILLHLGPIGTVALAAALGAATWSGGEWLWGKQ